MSSLRSIEKAQFEELFEMSGGYVLDFSNRSFSELIRDAVNIDIYDSKYGFNGDSKARRLRAFWEIEPDDAVGKVLFELLEYWKYKKPQPDALLASRFQGCCKIAERLLGKQVSPSNSEKQFLDEDFTHASLQKVPIDASLLPILRSRFEEATRCMSSDAPLAVIFHCGSILEGLLLGMASANPQHFNTASNSPKDNSGKVKPFYQWKLAEFIDVSCELGFLKLDVKKFSHSLRDFRNFIHPYQQLSSGFSPDKHTAEICLQVLRAAIASLSGERA